MHEKTILQSVDVPFIANAQMSQYTTFQLGGPSRGLFHCQTPRQLETTIQKLNHDRHPYILIGGGSNLCVSDEGIDCFVIRYVSDSPLIERDQTSLFVSGSTHFDHLVEFAAQNGLAGINTCSGIPGTVGGAVVGNAGAFGKQIGDAVTSVSLLTQTGDSKNVNANYCQFSYRNSILKETQEIVVSVELQLSSGNKDELLKERNEILQTRAEKHPDLSKEPCAGSFFRNIEPTSKAEKRQAAGWFLDQAGGKKLKKGGALIFPKHANIIVKSENCTSQDVFDLHNMMYDLGEKIHNLQLIREVHFVGRFEGMPSDVRPNAFIW